MKGKILWLALAFNVGTSFLGALLYLALCKNTDIPCGGTNPLGVFFPTVIAGTIILAIAHLVGRWTKKPVAFFVVTVLFAAIFNSGGESFDAVLLVVGGLPPIIAAVVAWFVGKEKNVQPPTVAAPNQPAA